MVTGSGRATLAAGERGLRRRGLPGREARHGARARDRDVLARVLDSASGAVGPRELAARGDDHPPGLRSRRPVFAEHSVLLRNRRPVTSVMPEVRHRR